MMKLNNKGFTIVEVLVTFILVSVVSISLFSTVSAFNEKRIIESQRAKVYEYKNSFATRMSSDFIEKGLAYASITRSGGSNSQSGVTTKVRCLLKDGTERLFVVHQRYTRSSLRIDGSTSYSDDFYIEYGEPDDLIREDLPDLGETRGYYDELGHIFVDDDDSKQCYNDKTGKREACVSKNLQINNVIIYITDENDPTSASHVLNIYVGFFGYDIGTKYAINVVAPIDYQKSVGTPESVFEGVNEIS